MAAHHHIGQCKLYTGSIDEAIPHVEQAIRLSPRDYQIGDYYSQIGVVHLLQSRTDEAITWLERARNAAPAPVPTSLPLMPSRVKPIAPPPNSQKPAG